MGKNKRTLLIIGNLLFMIYGAYWCYQQFDRIQGMRRPEPSNVTVPKGNCPTSLAVFNFRPYGDSDAKYYAIGFARALADRTYCAPKHVTQQISANEVAWALQRDKKDAAAAVSDELGVKLGKRMGVCYVVTGDLKLSRGKVDISLSVIDIAKPEAKQIFRTSGWLSELGSMQSELAPKVISAMKIKPDSVASAELKRCNFASSDILKIYGQSFTTTPKERGVLRWKAVQLDPNGSFAFQRLLDYYNNNRASCAELRNDKRLAQILSNPPAALSANSAIAVMRGLAYANQCKYEQAEAILRQVAKDDPEMIRARSGLGYIARLRRNGELALSEAKAASDAWPNNAFLHAALSEAYSVAANSIRQGHYYPNFTAKTEHSWYDSCDQSIREAYIAVKLDPDCQAGWFSIMENGREMSEPKDRDRAYENLLRLDPKNINVYTSYAFCFSTQWGASSMQQEQIFKQAEKAFPKGSYQPLAVRAFSLSSNFVDGKRVGGPYANDVLKLADEISRITGDGCEDALDVKSQAYEITRRRADFFKVCEIGYAKYGNLEWQYKLGMGCAFAYEDQHDRKYLERARQLFADYTRQVPFDPRGYVQVGWCLSHLGHRAEAKAQFEKALQLDPGNEAAKEKMKYVE